MNGLKSNNHSIIYRYKLNRKIHHLTGLKSPLPSVVPPELLQFPLVAISHKQKRLTKAVRLIFQKDCCRGRLRKNILKFAGAERILLTTTEELFASKKTSLKPVI